MGTVVRSFHIFRGASEDCNKDIPFPSWISFNNQTFRNTCCKSLKWGTTMLPYESQNVTCLAFFCPSLQEKNYLYRGCAGLAVISKDMLRIKGSLSSIQYNSLEKPWYCDLYSDNNLSSVNTLWFFKNLFYRRSWIRNH